MILTVTCNPAVDKTYKGERMAAGQVNRMKERTDYAGGKGINVARVLKQFGREVLTTGFLGGLSGQFIEKELEHMGIASDFISISQETRSNLNLITEDGLVTEILEEGPVIAERERERFLLKMDSLAGRAELIVLSGSLARGLEDSFYADIIRVCHQKKKPVILDSSKEALRNGILAAPDYIKPNLQELSYVAGKQLTGIHEITAAASYYLETGMKEVVVSMGAEGLLYMTQNITLQAVPPQIAVKNTVGCGDSIVAALCMAIQEQKSEEETARFLTAVSAANAATMENGSIPMEQMKGIYDKVKIIKL